MPKNAASADQGFTQKCFPDLPWPLKDWCKARGGSAPPPWRPNPNRGDQSVPNYVGEALTETDIGTKVKVVFFVTAALMALWFGTRVYEAWKR